MEEKIRLIEIQINNIPNNEYRIMMQSMLTAFKPMIDEGIISHLYDTMTLLGRPDDRDISYYSGLLELEIAKVNFLKKK